MTSLTPVEAITREIKDHTDAVAQLDALMYPYDKRVVNVKLFALELAKADAEFDQNNDSAVKYAAVIAARKKLYEALQR